MESHPEYGDPGFNPPQSHHVVMELIMFDTMLSMLISVLIQLFPNSLWL